MRAVLAGLFFGVLISSVALAEDRPTVLGAGVAVITSPYKGADGRTMALPFLSCEYKGFYLLGIEAGYRFHDKDGIVLSVFGQPRFMGYHSSDSDALAGMEDRRESFDLGLKAEYALPFSTGWAVEGKIIQDALSRYDGREAAVMLRKVFTQEHFRLTLSGGVKGQSRQLTGYYYGVTAAEVRTDRPAYRPGAALNPTAGVVVMSGLSQDWPVVLRLGVDRLDTNIRKSPLAGRDYVLTAALGVTRRF